MPVNTEFTRISKLKMRKGLLCPAQTLLPFRLSLRTSDVDALHHTSRIWHSSVA